MAENISKTLDSWLYALEAAYAEDRKGVLESLRREDEKGDENLDDVELEYRYQKWRTFYLMSSAAFGIHKGQEFLVMYFTMRPVGALKGHRLE